MIEANQSFWATTVQPGEASVLQGVVNADVAVVGAGLLGVSAAYHLSRLFPRKRIVVLEARRVANGASGRNGGAVLALTARATFDAMTGLAGRRGFLPPGYRDLWDRTAEGLDLFQEIIDRHGIDCGYSREGFLTLAASPRDAEAMARYAEAASRLGLPVRHLDAAACRRIVEAQGYHGGLLHPEGGQINPARYLCGLAHAARGLGVEIYENSPVIKIREGRTCGLGTPQGEVRSGAVVLAANAYAPRLGYFRHRVVPVLNACAVTEPLGAEGLRALGWRGTRGFHDSSWMLWYLGVSEDSRLIIGGGDVEYLYGGRTAHGARWLKRCRDRFARKLLRLFPGARDLRIEHVWAGAIDATLDLRPAVGVTGAHRNVFYGIGYTGEGVNLAHLSGKIVADLVSGNRERWSGLPFVGRLPVRAPPDPLRWAALRAAFALGRAVSS